MTFNPFPAAGRRVAYHYRGDRRRTADERRALIRALTEAVLSSNKMAEIVAGSELAWIEEAARTVQRRVQQALGRQDLEKQ
jgi:hypothetical protein